MNLTHCSYPTCDGIQQNDLSLSSSPPLISPFCFQRETGNLGRFKATLRENVLGSPKELMKLSVPSLVYAVQNNMAFLALSNLDAAVYQVSGNQKCRIFKKNMFLWWKDFYQPFISLSNIFLNSVNDIRYICVSWVDQFIVLFLGDVPIEDSLHCSMYCFNVKPDA